MSIYSNIIKPFLNHPLNKKQVLRSVFSFIRWQCLLRHAHANKSYIIAPYIGGLKVIAKKGLHGITGNLYSGLHEFDEMGFVLHFLKKDDLFLDLGANVGAYTLLASGVRKARSFAFEPIPSTYYFLKNNIGINNLESLVTLYNFGLSKSESVLRFSSDNDAMNKVVGDGYTGQSQLVKVSSLDKIIDFKLEQTTCIKIDTEGFEHQILLGAQTILTNPHVKAVIVEMNDAENINEILLKYGFKAYGYDVLKKELLSINFRKVSNAIYLRDEEYILERIRASEAVTVNGHII